jgi:hypothetical protein
MLETGTYAPVLEVRSAKSNEILFIGRDGLTRNIYYKDRLALEYVSAKLGVPKPHTLKEIGHCASQPGEDREPDAAPAIDPDPVTPTTETPTVDETPEVETPTTEEVDVVAVVF